MRKSFILFVLVGITQFFYAQDIPQAYPSPEAASLGIVGNIPVNHYGGEMNFSIPLFDLNINDYAMPISLSYNSSGFRPNPMTGWVGQNWTLNAGGVIVRNVKGQPDETDDYGYLYSYAKYKNKKLAEMEEHEVKRYDGEPDEFFFNANGISGKFYLNDQGEFTVISDPGTKVEWILKKMIGVNDGLGRPTGKTFWGFMITTIDGTMYIFGCDQSYIETSNTAVANSEINTGVASSWYLAEIILPQRGERIQFSYSKKYFDAVTTRTEVVSFLAVHFDIKMTSWSQHGTDCLPGQGLMYIDSYINHIYLKSIECSTFKIDFYTSKADLYQYIKYPGAYTPEWQKLDSVRLTSKNPELELKKVMFTYDKNNNTAKRLILTSIQESGRPPYLFEYYKFPTDKSIASIGFDSKEIDHWGYYNGYAHVGFQGYDQDIYTLIPTTFEDNEQSFYYPDREPNPDYISIGMLKKVTYPTGGSSLFEYEANDYSKYPEIMSKRGNYTKMETVNVEKHWNRWKKIQFRDKGTFKLEHKAYIILDIYPHSSSLSPVRQKSLWDAGSYTEKQLLAGTGLPMEGNLYEFQIQYKELIPTTNAYAGGTRIKKIIQKDKDTELVTRYKYVKNYSPADSSNLSSGTLSMCPKYVYSVSTERAPCYLYFVNVYYSITRAQSFTPLEMTKGKHVGYSEITELKEDNEGNLLGYTVYKYTDFDMYPDFYPYELYNVYIGDMGVRTSMDYKRGRLLSETIYSASGQIIRQKEYSYIQKSKDDLSGLNVAMSPISPCIAINEMVYGITNYTIKDCTFLPEQEKVTLHDSDGKTITTITGYEYDDYDQIKKQIVTGSDGSKIMTEYKYPADEEGSPYKSLVEKHILNPIVEKTVIKDSSPLFKEKWDYQTFGANIYPASYKIQKGLEEWCLKTQYHAYDWYGNPLYISTDGSEIVYLWAYGQYMQAEIKNTTIEEVRQFVNPELGRNEFPVAAEVDTLRTLLPNAHVTTYEYIPHIGMTSVTDPRGKKITYHYDDYYRLKEIKDSDNKIIERYDYGYKRE